MSGSFAESVESSTGAPSETTMSNLRFSGRFIVSMTIMPDFSKRSAVIVVPTQPSEA
jgi:hypothetical protein